jgi:hypothetical protein
MSAVELKFSVGEQNGTLKFGNARTCEPKHTEGLAGFCISDLARMFGGHREKATAAVFGRRCKLASKTPSAAAPTSIAQQLTAATTALAAGDRDAVKAAVVTLGAEALRWLEEIEELE